MINLLNALFRTGIPYDAEHNQFTVQLQDVHRLENECRQIAQEEEWPRRQPHFLRPGRGWDDFDF